MTTILIQDILQYLTLDKTASNLDTDPKGYNTYTVPSDMVIQIARPDYPNDPYCYTITTVTVINSVDDDEKIIPESFVYICELEGLSCNPVNILTNNNVSVKVYKQIS